MSPAGAGTDALFGVLRGIPDPEVPALDIVELGIVRRVELSPDGAVTVEVTPTYSGCPAMRMIEQEIVAALHANGYDRVELRTVYSPAWTTDWLSDSAKAKLKAYGIAAPDHTVAEQALVPLTSSVRRVACPYCGSSNTERKSEFGSTACKAIHYCHHCQQPFEEFKAI
ncbi:MAG TPA: 1,2-phenylacetyl-CoA epoxidase subunit PaaD [Gemmatimonadales bacterium]|nr:1,2-phenylacetyl-CoA epoxidase subunit PaaD [Gemmatimonadales bacterium]